MKTSERLILFGIGQNAEVAYYYFKHDSPYKIVAFTLDREWMKKDRFHNLPVIAFDEIENVYPPEKYKMFVSISFTNLNKLRKKKYQEAKEKGYELISYVCSRATTWPNLDIGDNCFIFEDNVIQPYVKIGNNVILWSGNHIGHHTTIGDHCFIASHVVISGSVTVGERCFFGVNSTIRDNIKIAKNCVIGAGAIITKDTVENGIYYGPRANVLKQTGDSKNLNKI